MRVHLWGLFVFLIIGSIRLEATSFRELPDHIKFENAQFICLGEVLEVLKPPTEKALFTPTRVKILDCAKGNLSGTEILVRWPGGGLGSRKSVIPGITYLQAGETGLLYMNRQPGQEFYHLDEWRIPKLKKEKNSDEYLFEESGSLQSRSRSGLEQVERRSWKHFKEKVRQELR